MCVREISSSGSEATDLVPEICLLLLKILREAAVPLTFDRRDSSWSNTDRGCSNGGEAPPSCPIPCIQSRTMLLDFLLPLPVSTFTWPLLGSLKGLLNTSSNARSFRKVVMDGSRRRVPGLKRSPGPRILKAGIFAGVRPRCSTKSVGPYAKFDSTTRS